MTFVVVVQVVAIDVQPVAIVPVPVQSRQEPCSQLIESKSPPFQNSHYFSY